MRIFLNGGGSAGAIIFGEDIESCAWDDKNNIQLENTTGFDVLQGVSLLCHYTNHEKERDAENTEYLLELSKKRKVIALPEEVTLFISGNHIEVIGFRPYYVFENGIKVEGKYNMDVIEHYDCLIDENNDPVLDSKTMQAYMDKWDGPLFMEALELSKDKNVLEIGVGTGRIAKKVVPKCGHFVGIDISPKTIERAKEHLGDYENVELICGDFMEHSFAEKFNLVYISLAFMHFKEKAEVMQRIADLMEKQSRFVLSIEKNQAEYIDMGTRNIKIYPDKPKDIKRYLKDANLRILKQFETEFSHVFVIIK